MKKFTTFALFFLMMIGMSFSAKAFEMTFNVTDGSTIPEFSGKLEITVVGATTDDLAVNGYEYVQFYRVSDDGENQILANTGLEFDKETGNAVVNFPSYNLWPDYPVQTAGKYLITIPAGVIYWGEEANEATEINFTIEPYEKFVMASEVTITPAPGPFEEIIPQFVITLPEDVTSVGFNEVAAGSSSYYGTLYAKAQFLLGSYSYGEYDIVADGNVLTLTPSSTLIPADLEQGEWSLRILRDAMYFNDDPTKTNEMIVIGKWTYPDFQKMSIEPEDGSKLLDINEFIVKFSGAWGTVEGSIVEGTTPTLHSYDVVSGTSTKVCDLAMEVIEKEDEWDEYKVKLIVDPSIASTLAYGTYQIEIPKGQFSFNYYKEGNDGELIPNKTIVNARQVATFEYLERPSISLVPTWGIEEGQTVESFKEVTLTFPEATEIEYVGEYEYPYITINQIVDGVATPWGGGEGALDVKIEGNKITLFMYEQTFTPNYPIDVDGEYRVIVPKGKFAFEGIPVFVNEEEYVLNFKVDAMDPTITTDMATIDPAPSIVKDMYRGFTVTLEGVEGQITLADVETTEYDYATGDYVTKIAPAQAKLVQLGNWGPMKYGTYDITIEGNVLTLSVNDSMTEEMWWEYGNYYIQFPKGSLLVDGDATKFNELIEFGPYTIERLVSGMEIIDPIPGNVESLSTFTLELNDAWETPTDAACKPIKIAKFDESTSEYVALDNEITTQTGFNDEQGWCEFTLTLATEITEPGKYKLIIEKGTYKWVDWWSEETYFNDEFVAEYEIEAPIDPAVAFTPISVDPAEGEVAELSVVTMTFDSKYFPKGLWDEGAKVELYDENEDVVATGYCSTPGTNDPVLKIYIEDETGEVATITTPGEYVLVVEEGMIQSYDNSEIANPEFHLFYTIVAPVADCTLTVTPAGGEEFADATELSEAIDDTTFSIKVEGEGIETIEVNPSFLDWNSWTLITLWDTDSNWGMGEKTVALYPVLKEGTTNEFSLVRFTESGIEWPITTAGAGYFVLDIPEGAFTVNGEASPAAAYAYKFDGVGVEAVDMDAQDLNVYSINGMLIKRNASWREVLNFEPGVYIVNGEKVYIRK